jgi:hypothetical protein
LGYLPGLGGDFPGEGDKNRSLPTGRSGMKTGCYPQTGTPKKYVLLG